MAVWHILEPHNPYRVLHHYKRHVCVLSCSCKKKISTDISSFCVFVWSEKRVLQYAIESVGNRKYSSHRLMWIFNQHLRPVQAINQNIHLELREMCWCNVLWHLNQVCWLGLERWRWTIPTPQSNPELQGTYCIYTFTSTWDRSEYDTSILYTLPSLYGSFGNLNSSMHDPHIGWIVNG